MPVKAKYIALIFQVKEVVGSIVFLFYDVLSSYIRCLARIF